MDVQVGVQAFLAPASPVNPSNIRTSNHFKHTYLAEHCYKPYDKLIGFQDGVQRDVLPYGWNSRFLFPMLQYPQSRYYQLTSRQSTRSASRLDLPMNCPQSALVRSIQSKISSYWALTHIGLKTWQTANTLPLLWLGGRDAKETGVLERMDDAWTFIKLKICIYQTKASGR